MSNTPRKSSSRTSGNRSSSARSAAKRKASGGSLAKYRKEAGGEPFPFELDDGRVIKIPRPTGGRLMDLAEKYAGIDLDNPTGVDPREQFRDLLSDAYDEVMPILEDEDFGVMMALLKDLVEYFDLGEALASFA